MNDYVNKMLDAALKKNMDTFQNAFRSGVIDKIDTQLQTKRDEVSFDSMKYVESTDDVVKESIKPSNYHFKNSSAAKKFVSAITKMGVEKKKFHIKNDDKENLYGTQCCRCWFGWHWQSPRLNLQSK